LQARTCQIPSLAENPRWSPSVAIKFLTKNIEIQNEIMKNQIEKQNIGMSADIDIEVTEKEIKNKNVIMENEIKI